MATSHFEPRPGEPRLDSWKAIAAYLERDVRTAKRWEVHEGLPIRRHRHLARSTVYAYPREIELWRAARLPDAPAPTQGLFEAGRRWVLLAAGIALAVLAAGGGRFTGPIELAAQATNLTATRLTWPEGDEIMPIAGVSRRGGYIAFPNNDNALATRTLDGDQVVVVPNESGWGQGHVEFVQPSPEGDVIAYTWWNVPESRYELRTIARAGGVPRTIHAAGVRAYVRPLGWTPDGGRVIAVVSQSVDAGSAVTLSSFSMDPSPVEHVIARYTGGDVEGADVSADGRWIAYAYSPGRNDPRADIYIASLDGGDPRPLVATEASEVVLGWLPDDRHLMYMSNTGGTIGAWLVAVEDGRETGEPVFVKGDLGRFTGFGFTADGRFYSGVTVGGTDVKLVPLDPRTGLAAGEPTPLAGAQAGVRRGQGTWSPDGDRIAFYRSAPMTATTLAIQHRDSGRLDVIPLPVWNLERPNWHPDGRRVVILGQDDANRQSAYEVELASGDVTRITGRTPYAVYTPDGEYLIYRRPQDADSPAAIVRRRLSDASEAADQVIFRGPAAFLLSPDGTTLLLYQAGGVRRGVPDPTSTLSIVPVAGGEPRLVLDGIVDAVPAEFAFSADGRYAYYVTGRRSALMDIWRVAIDGNSPPERLGASLSVINHLSANPDGSSLAVSGGAARFETWVWDKPGNVVR